MARQWPSHLEVARLGPSHLKLARLRPSPSRWWFLVFSAFGSVRDSVDPDSDLIPDLAVSRIPDLAVNPLLSSSPKLILIRS